MAKANEYRFEKFNFQDLVESPANPIADTLLFYAKGGKFYFKDNLGVETELSSGSFVPTSRTINTKELSSNISIGAVDIDIEDAGNNFIETNIEGALAELFQSVSSGKILVASAITDKGVTTSNNDSFGTMASNIGLIESGGGGAKLFELGLNFEPILTNIIIT